MQTYDEMVDSGVDWIGQIPHSWRVKKFSSLYKTTNAGEVIPKEFWDPDGQLIMYTASQKPIRAIFSRFPESKLTTDNDILIARNGDGVIHDPRPGSIYTNVVQRVSLDIDSVSKKYLIYALKASLSYVHGQSNGDFIVSLNMGMWNSTRLPMPASPVQQKIADFLDTETAKIDDLIAKQEKLLELLEEKRRATITHAVTRGLDPEVELKETDIPWLKHVNNTYSIVQLRNCIFGKLKYGASETGEEMTDDWPRYIRITDFGKDGRLKAGDYLTLHPRFLRDYSVSDGDILFARSGATVGKAYQLKIDSNSNQAYCFAGYLIKATPDPSKILSDFLKFYTESTTFGNWKEYVLNKATIENIGADKYAALRIPLPTIEEQNKICVFLVEKQKKFDKLKQKIQTQIALLRERRTSLISHAVTGKVKI